MPVILRRRRASAEPDRSRSSQGTLGHLVAGLAGGRVAGTGLSALWMVVAARQLPVADFGDLLLLLGLGSLFLVVNDFGLPLALTDAVARRPETGRGALIAATCRRLGLGVLSAAMVATAYLVSAQDREPLVPLVFAVSMLASTVYTSAAAYFRGTSRVRAESVNEVVSRAFVLAAGGWWLLQGGGLLSAVLVYALADVGSAVVLGALAWRATRPASAALERRTFSLRSVAPVALAAALGVVYYRVDLWIVALRLGPEDVALYGSAYRVVEALLLGAAAVAALSVPAMARIDSPERRSRLLRLVGTGLLVTVPLAVAALVGGGTGMSMIFGEPYGRAGGLLRILVLAAIPGVVVTVLAPLAFLRGRSRAAAGFAVVLSLNVGLNLALLPVLGVQGAAWATLACQAILASVLWRSINTWVSERSAPPRPEPVPSSP